MPERRASRLSIRFLLAGLFNGGRRHVTNNNKAQSCIDYCSPDRSLVSGSLLAQMGDPLTLDPLWVSSPRAESDWFTLPMAVSAVDAQDHPGEQLLSLDALLAPVPA